MSNSEDRARAVMRLLQTHSALKSAIQSALEIGMKPYDIYIQTLGEVPIVSMELLVDALHQSSPVDLDNEDAPTERMQVIDEIDEPTFVKLKEDDE
jgi:hypothetical protein